MPSPTPTELATPAPTPTPIVEVYPSMSEWMLGVVVMGIGSGLAPGWLLLVGDNPLGVAVRIERTDWRTPGLYLPHPWHRGNEILDGTIWNDLRY